MKALLAKANMLRATAGEMPRTDTTVHHAVVETAKALDEIATVLTTLSERIGRAERALMLLAMDDRIPADTRLDIGILLSGGEPE